MNAISLIARIDAISQMTISRRPKIYRERVDPFQIPEDQFKARYRLNKSTVQKIINIVRPEIELNKRGCGTSAELQVLVALRCWGRREIQDDAADLHGLTQPTVCRNCARVARALARLGKNKIKMPQTFMEEQIVMRDFKCIKNFPGVIGAIDCDSKLIIRDVVARWRGSTHDCRIFNESTIKQRFESGEFRGRLLGDSGYKLQSYLFTPLLRPQNQKESKYNTAQIATRNPVERCFGVWKQRFRCLLDGLRISLKNAKTLIVALAILHNIAIEENDLVPDDNTEEQNLNAVDESEIYNNNTQPVDRRAKIVLKTFI